MQVVLQQLSVFWAHLFMIPKTIIGKIKIFLSNFIWNGRREDRKYHLVSWDLITCPKYWGGWGILDVDLFGKVLLIKSLWRCMHTPGIWHDIITFKYLGQKNMEGLFSVGWEKVRRGSHIWNKFMKV